MNILDGMIEDGKLTLANGAGLAGQYDVAGSVKVGIRPEHLIVDTDGGLQIDVISTEPLGATTLLHGKLASSGESITASLPGVHQIDSLRGATRLGIKTDHIHIFSSSTSMRQQ